MEDRICPVCRKVGVGKVCNSCNTDLELFDRKNANIRDLMNKAIKDMDDKAYCGALQLLNEALQINQNDSAVLLMTGLCHYVLGDWEKADALWKKSQNSLASEYRFKARGEKEAFDRGIKGYTQALSLIQDNKTAAAIGVLNKTLNYDHPYLPALELLALAYYQSKRYGQCWRIYKKIQKISVDAPVLAKLTLDLPKKVVFVGAGYTLAVLLAVAGVYNFQARQSLLTKQLIQTKVVERALPAATPKPDREKLQAEAEQLAKNGDVIGSAEVLLELNTNKDCENTATSWEKYVWQKAAANYYFEGMRQMRKHQYSEAAMAFSMSLRYPTHSYVYDDTLYYQALVRERMGIPERAIVLYRQLLKEQPDSNYCQAAIVRWSQLANQDLKLRPEFIKALQEYPAYTNLMQSRVKAWKEQGTS